ncbi:hypothetical protein SLNHY_0488 [Streptomyces albus]|nr:hypothetical protein SLNHY_0488 [Streptomyces albus]
MSGCCGDHHDIRWRLGRREPRERDAAGVSRGRVNCPSRKAGW